MASAVVEDRGQLLDCAVRVTMTRDQLGIVKALADTLDSTQPAALRYLIDFHGGKLLAEEVAAKERAPAPFSVIRFGRPRLSTELIAYIAGTIAAGLSLDSALDLASVTTKQRREWWRRGEADMSSGTESLYADYVAAVRQAKAQVKWENIEEIKRHRARTFKASAWLLERMYPEEFGERKRVDSSVTHSLMPMVDFERLTLHEQKQLVRLLRKASPDGAEISPGSRARPAAELLPGDLVDAIEDAEWHEVDAEAPALGEPEAPALGVGADGEGALAAPARLEQGGAGGLELLAGEAGGGQAEAPAIGGESPGARAEAPALGGDPAAPGQGSTADAGSTAAGP